MSRPRVVAIVPAAGCGKRLGSRTGKPFVMLAGRPLISYALKALEACPAIDGIIVAAEKPRIGRVRSIARSFKIKKLLDVIAGGKTRFESVGNCLSSIGRAFDIVLVHDAARPLVDRITIERSIKEALASGACVVAVPETDTVKLSGDGIFVETTLDRNKIFRAQTPQAFRYEVIKKAYLAPDYSRDITDDSSLVERLGRKVKILKGSCKNIKITTRDDLKIAEALLCG